MRFSLRAPSPRRLVTLSPSTALRHTSHAPQPAPAMFLLAAEPGAAPSNHRLLEPARNLDWSPSSAGSPSMLMIRATSQPKCVFTIVFQASHLSENISSQTLLQRRCQPAPVGCGAWQSRAVSEPLHHRRGPCALLQYQGRLRGCIADLRLTHEHVIVICMITRDHRVKVPFPKLTLSTQPSPFSWASLKIFLGNSRSCRAASSMAVRLLWYRNVMRCKGPAMNSWIDDVLPRVLQVSRLGRVVVQIIQPSYCFHAEVF